MPAGTFDVVVVGAGMIGSAAAKYLISCEMGPQARLPSVCLLGPLDNCSGTSRGQHFDVARITRRIDASDPLWAAWSDASMRRYRDIEAEAGIDFYDPCGFLWLSSDHLGTEVAAIRQSAAVLPGDAHGLIHEFSSLQKLKQTMRVASKLNVEAFEPSVVFHDESGGVIHPNRLVQAQIAIAAKRGGHRFTHLAAQANRVEAIAPTGDSQACYKVCFSDKEGAAQSVLCSKVVVCCGAFTILHDLLPAGKVPAVDLVPEITVLVPLAARTPPAGDSWPGQPENMRSASVISTSGALDTHFYCLPPQFYEDSRRWYVKLGASATTSDVPARVHSIAEAIAWTDGETTSHELKQRFAGIVRALYSGWEFDDLEPCRTLQCVFDRTPHRLPYIGCVDGEGWFAAVGGNGKAAKSSDELGRILSEHVMGRGDDKHLDFVWK
jgi:sarcosine oxidase